MGLSQVVCLKRPGEARQFIRSGSSQNSPELPREISVGDLGSKRQRQYVVALKTTGLAE